MKNRNGKDVVRCDEDDTRACCSVSGKIETCTTGLQAMFKLDKTCPGHDHQPLMFNGAIDGGKRLSHEPICGRCLGVDASCAQCKPALVHASGLPPDTATAALTVPRRASSAADLKPGMRVRVQWNAGHETYVVAVLRAGNYLGDKPGDLYGENVNGSGGWCSFGASSWNEHKYEVTIVADPQPVAIVEVKAKPEPLVVTMNEVYEKAIAMTGIDESRGNVPTSGRLLGASPIPRPTPDVAEVLKLYRCSNCGKGDAQAGVLPFRCGSCCARYSPGQLITVPKDARAVEYTHPPKPACDPRCVRGCPCRRLGCVNACDDDSEESLFERQMAAVDRIRGAQGQGSGRPIDRPPADSIADMLGASPFGRVLLRRRR